MDAAEQARLQQMCLYEQAAYAQGYGWVAGVDEAGRGPLAGPVLAAACILPKELLIPGIDDSKKLTPLKRRRLCDYLTSHPAVVYAIGCAEPAEIDRINIYQATLCAMWRAVDQLPQRPDYLLVDGMPLVRANLPSQKIIKGDQLSQSIAAASILAKETRDRLMEAYHRQWPLYGFDRHKGYGTARHLEALARHGPCPIHRRSFAPVAPT